MMTQKVKAMHRSRLFILHEILTIITTEKAIVTTVSRRAQISHMIATNYLDILCKSDCIKKVQIGIQGKFAKFEYVMAPKGFTFLKALDGFCEILRELNLQL